MQSFVMTICHVAELKNKIADWFSRLEQHYLEDANSQIDLLEKDIDCLLFITLEFDEVDIDTPTVSYVQVHNVIELESEREIEKVWSPEEMFAEVHGESHMHKGVRQTWLMADKWFPRHRMRYDYIEKKIG